MVQRYFLDTPIGSATSVVLQGSEAQHLTRVMRGKCGDRVELFDGSGWQWNAEIAQVGRNEATLKILSTTEVDLEPALALTVGIALPKGDRQKWIIEKLVELGVTTVIPITTTRGVAQPVDKALVRLRNHVISASKQCGRNRLLEIGEVASFEAFIKQAGENLFFAHPKSAQDWSQQMRLRKRSANKSPAILALEIFSLSQVMQWWRLALRVGFQLKKPPPPLNCSGTLLTWGLGFCALKQPL